MKNVVVFASHSMSFAVELGWVRDIFNLPYVTPVPLAPASCVGLVNFRGTLLPVIDVERLWSERSDPARAREGEPAIALEVGDAQFALVSRNIEAVTTLNSKAQTGTSHPLQADVLKYLDKEVVLLDPSQISTLFASQVS